MSAKLVVFVCFQVFLVQGRVFAQAILPQCLPSPIVQPVVPNCGCQQVVPQIVPQIVSVPQVSVPAVVQDSSVSNGLANALQLLVVSNLLSATLPRNEVIVPCSGAPLSSSYYAPQVLPYSCGLGYAPPVPPSSCGCGPFNAYGGLISVL